MLMFSNGAGQSSHFRRAEIERGEDVEAAKKGHREQQRRAAVTNVKEFLAEHCDIEDGCKRIKAGHGQENGARSEYFSLFVYVCCSNDPDPQQQEGGKNAGFQ